MTTQRAQFNDVHIAGIYILSETQGKKQGWGKGKSFFVILLTSELT